MLGEYVLTQHDLQESREKYDSIGMAGYNIDIREVQWAAHKVYMFPNVIDEAFTEGYLSMPVEPWQIPYRALLPKQQQCSNLLVTVCISASTIAYASFRMEANYMIAGQSAGAAAALAIKSGRQVHQVDMVALQRLLRGEKQILSSRPMSLRSDQDRGKRLSKSRGISRRKFNILSAALGVAASPMQSQTSRAEAVLPGIWRLRFGTPEALTPVKTRRYQPAREALANLTPVNSPPLPLIRFRGSGTNRGFKVSLPLEPDEMVYGLGLQFHSFLQRGLKKKLRVNADPSVDLGDSHAPVPFYVSARGYGVLIDTARYVNIYCGNKVKKGTSRASESATPSQSAAISASARIIQAVPPGPA